MSKARGVYCTLDHANKRRELAERSPYQFWVEQLHRESAQRVDEATERGRKSAGRKGACRRGTRLRSSR